MIRSIFFKCKLNVIFNYSPYYFTHCKAPWDHSKYRPINKIKIKKIEVIDQIKILEIFNRIIIGKINTISTSKIKKIIVIKKNRIDKGNRDLLIGSNPHSNGVNFS